MPVTTASHQSKRRNLLARLPAVCAVWQDRKPADFQSSLVWHLWLKCCIISERSNATCFDFASSGVEQDLKCRQNNALHNPFAFWLFVVKLFQTNIWSDFITVCVSVSCNLVVKPPLTMRKGFKMCRLWAQTVKPIIVHTADCILCIYFILILFVRVYLTFAALYLYNYVFYSRLNCSKYPWKEDYKCPVSHPQHSNLKATASS